MSDRWIREMRERAEKAEAKSAALEREVERLREEKSALRSLALGVSCCPFCDRCKRRATEVLREIDRPAVLALSPPKETL